MFYFTQETHMAKRKLFKVKNKVNPEQKIPFYKDDRFVYSLGVLLIFFSFYLCLSFISYLFTWQADQSFEFQKTLSASDIKVSNWAGKLGADLASLFITNWFGIASFSFPFLVFILGGRLIHLNQMPLGKTIKISLIATILFSLVMSFIAGDGNGYLVSGPGGHHGYFIVTWLNAFAGIAGTGFILSIAIFCFIIFSSPKSLSSFKKFVLQLRNNIKERKERKAEKEKQQVAAENISEEDDDTAFINNIEKTDEISKDIEIAKQDINEAIPSEDIKDDDQEENQEEPKSEITEENKNQFTIQTFADENDLVLINEEFEIEDKTDEETNDLEVIIDKGKKEEIDNRKRAELEDYDPTLDLEHYKLPSIDLLENHKSTEKPISDEEIIENKNKIVETLANYKIQIDKIKATVGPTVTLYEIVPAPGVRISKIKNLEDDIALSLAALGIRIIAPIPGRGTIGIEVPNPKPEIVSMRSVVQSMKFRDNKFDLTIGLGKTIQNETFVVDLAKMPHLLVAGATGQGKSVGLNAIIASLLFKKHPAQLKFVFIDPKKVELTPYAKIEKHFLAKLPDAEEAIITDTQKVINTLNSLCIEMDNRYELLKAAHVRNIKEYNGKFIKRQLNPEKGHRFLPYIVVVIDEFADLIMTAGREIETPIARLAQLARAIGIHLIIATQRPTTNIITGVIKANFPARIAFRVSAMVDSRTILDSPGANQLIGRGDMLVSQGSDLVRVQCAFIDTPELEKITDYIAKQQSYTSAMELPEYVNEGENDLKEVDLNKRDTLFDDAARAIVASQQGSTSMIQRKFSIGYNRAGRIIDQLEAAGIVGPFEGSKARQVLITDDYSLEQILNSLN